MQFSFGDFKTEIFISREVPEIGAIINDYSNALIIADENTAQVASEICGSTYLPLCIIKSGEENKNWQSIDTILSSAITKGLGRDCVFIAVGGGIICDIAGFAASVYMRGCRLVFVTTTLLGMVDASVGGKTGVDLYGVKNLAGTFYPAERIYMPLDCLATLSRREWKSGIAELIKIAVLAGDEYLEKLKPIGNLNFNNFNFNAHGQMVRDCIERAIVFKDSIVSEDLRDSFSGKRKLLNLGHTFGHALESVLGLGNISHGEAVAWGITRVCELGVRLGITPANRARFINDLIRSFGYNLNYSFDTNAFLGAMDKDKKKKNGKLTFIIPDTHSAKAVILENENDHRILNDILIKEI